MKKSAAATAAQAAATKAEQPSGRAEEPEKAEGRERSAPPLALRAGQGDQWREPAEIAEAAGELLNGAAGRVLAVDLSGLEHLDASALQVLLAIEAAQRQRGGGLEFTHVSDNLRKWFDYAGAAGLLSAGGAAAREGEAPCARL